jgi:hypothetical protein
MHVKMRHDACIQIGIPDSQDWLMNADERNALSGVVEVARRELADREPDEIPAKLKRVALSSARSLPPPFADSLIGELVSNEPFRLAVHKRWDTEGLDDPVGSVFLTNPDEAKDMLDALGEEAADVRQGASLAALQHHVKELERTLAEAKARTDKSDKAVREGMRDAKQADKRARKSLADGAASARRDRDSAMAEVTAATAKIVALETALEESQRTIERLRERLRRRPGAHNADRAVDPGAHLGADRSADRPGDRSDAPQDPLLLAVWLDTIERRLRPYRASSLSPERVHQASELHLPNGIAPDTAEAIDALIVQHPTRFIIDGYNVSGAVDPSSFSTRAGREAALAMAGRLVRSTDAPVVVVFDAPGIDGREEYASDFGAQVRFSREGSADDAIVRDVAENPVGTVVVTNDREVRERVTAVGALALWSDALLAWASPGS